MRFRRLRGKAYVMEAGEFKCYGPGSIFDGEKSALGQSLDQWEQLDPDPEPIYEKPSRGLQARPRADAKNPRNPWWDVINPETGEPINSRPLTRAQALDMVGNDPLDELRAEPAGE